MTGSIETKDQGSGSVLITGGGGFTGGHLINHLEAIGYSTRTISELFSTSRIDIMDKDSVSDFIAEFKPTRVIHLAGISRTQAYDHQERWKANSLGARNVIEAFMSKSPYPEHFVLASTAQVYSGSSSPIDENSDVKPQGEYAKSKLAAEQALLEFDKKVKVSIVRPFNYTGIGQASDFLIPKLVQAFNSGLSSISLGNTDVRRDFSDVRDVVTAYAGILASNQSGGVFNICQGKGWTIKELLALLGRIYDREMIVEFDSNLSRPSEPKSFVGDFSKIFSVVGWSPKLELVDTLLWMKNSPK